MIRRMLWYIFRMIETKVRLEKACKSREDPRREDEQEKRNSVYVRLAWICKRYMKSFSGHHEKFMWKIVLELAKR